MRRSKRRGHSYETLNAPPLTIDGQPVVLGERLVFPDPLPVDGVKNGVYVVSEMSPYRDGFRMWPEDILFYIGMLVVALGVVFLLGYLVSCALVALADWLLSI